jgi:hypothetical protein|tara:strand:+ start:980 stop:1465 length:486 start_codon:yes stop_codon:yes gene_type:complete
MTELSIEHIVILAIMTFVLYHFMNRCNYNGFSVGGMKTVTKCTDLATGYQPLCGLLKVPKERCSDYYTESWVGNKGYFCVPDDDSTSSYKCKQDDVICSQSDEIQGNLPRYIRWLTDNRTFINKNKTFKDGKCDKCGGCGEQLDSERSVCNNDKSKWCYCA